MIWPFKKEHMMQNPTITTTTPRVHFDIEGNTPSSHQLSSRQKAVIAGCSALAMGCATLGSLLLAGSIGRVGPFAVKHDYVPSCTYSRITGANLGCGMEDNSDTKAITYGALGIGAMVAAALLGVAGVKRAQKQR